MKDCKYHEHIHVCSDCKCEWRAYWVYEWAHGANGLKEISCPCDEGEGLCQDCTIIREAKKPLYSHAWIDENGKGRQE